MIRNQTLNVLVLVSILTLGGLAVSVSTAAATVDTAVAQTDNREVCTGSPQMSRISITSPQNSITTETPAKIEANFRVDPTVPAECTVIADLQYSFTQSGFQFGGGSDWQQSASDIVATRFELGSGEIRSVSADIHTNGAGVGDELTVIADYEIWYEGNRENSRQVSGLRQTVTVESPNRPGGVEEPPSEPSPLAEFVMNNFALLGIVFVSVIAVTGLVKREPIVNVFSNK